LTDVLREQRLQHKLVDWARAAIEPGTLLLIGAQGCELLLSADRQLVPNCRDPIARDHVVNHAKAISL
jgi:hypothetical protein